MLNLTITMFRTGIAVLCILCFVSCTVSLPQETRYESLRMPGLELPERQLLDVGIQLFDADNNRSDPDDLNAALLSIRSAESRYMPVVLLQTLRSTDNWGQIHLLTTPSAGVDVLVRGSIVESNGHTLVVDMHVSDTSGKTWFDRRYTAHVGDNVYGPTSLGVNDPFQGLYNQIANDLAEYQNAELTAADTARLRKISELRFAGRFSPRFSESYLSVNDNQQFSLQALPAQNDPMLARIKAIRERDQFFLLTLTDQQQQFARQIAEPYYNWRRDFYRALLSQQEAQEAARWRVLSGTLLLGAAVMTSDVSSALTVTSSAAAGYIGAQMISQGLNGYLNSNESSRFLEELEESFSNEVTSQVVAVESRSATLTGNVNERYVQWQQILLDIYQAENELPEESQVLLNNAEAVQ